MAIIIKTKEEIDLIREGGHRLGAILAEVAASARPGVSAAELDRRAERLILAAGGLPAFKGYRVKETRIPYPASLCVSVNDEVVHAIPHADRIFKDGDVVGLDIGMRYQKLYTDMAVTVGIGKISSDAARLIRTTKEALAIGIQEVHPGAHVGDIGAAIETHLIKEKLGIIRDLAGHGVGYALHEEPLIPNYGKKGQGPELREGMVIAIEPMATLGGWRVMLDDDEWTFRTADGSIAAHFEHTVAVVAGGVEILTEMQNAK